MSTRLASIIFAVAGASIVSATPADTPPPATPHPLTAEDAAAFLDGMLPSALAMADVAGATLAIVKDDGVLLTRAYGLADVEKQLAVSAQDTLFRPASISKLFTWTAVMQQVEAGKLDLDHDINEYLDFKIEGYGGQPIKLRHLMTHTAGFEESLLDLLVDRVEDVKPLGEALKHSIPARIYPPGTVPAYSNYGAALAGYIVSRASGVPFEQYIEERIFKPLRMEHSSFRQPAPEALRDHLSKSYITGSGEVVPFELGWDAPAGALSSTAPDMAQFMMAHLNGGLLPGGDDANRILKPQTTELMHSVANRPAPVVDAMCYGFYEQSRNGVRVIAHGGDLTAFHSELVLIPAAKVGLFISFNSSGKNSAVYNVRTAVFESFMDRYFPRQAAAPIATPADTKEHAAALAGNYEDSRRSDQNLFSFLYMFLQSSTSVRDDGSVVVGGLDSLNGEPKKFREVQPWLWQEEHGEQRFGVTRDDKGRVLSIAPDGYGAIIVKQRPPAWRNKAWLMPAILVATVIVALALVIRVAGFLRRRFSRAPAPAPVADRNRRRSFAALLSCAVFIVLCLLVLAMFAGQSFWVISSDARWFLRLLQLSALLAVLGAIVSVMVAVDTWRSPARTRSLVIGRTALAAACLVWAYCAIAFHFLSIRLQY